MTNDKNATFEVIKEKDNVEGVTTVTVTAEDGVSTKPYKVEFILHHKPVIILNGDATITIAHDGIYEEQGATASDEEDGNITDSITTTGTVTTSVSGTYEVLYHVVDSNGYEAEVIRTVIVEKDKEAKLKELAPVPNDEFDTENKALKKAIYLDEKYNAVEALMVEEKTRPKKIPSEVNMDSDSGLLLCQDINFSGYDHLKKDSLKSKGVKMEILGLEASLGIVDVENDGSVYLTIVADTPFQIQTLDETGTDVNGPGSCVYLSHN